MRSRWSVVALVVAGVVVGGGGVITTQVMVAATGSNEFCGSACHSMTWVAQEYKQSVHFANRTGVQPKLVEARCFHAMTSGQTVLYDAAGRLLFNGPIVGMRGDPLPAAGARPAPIRLHRARFFDAVCSNELGTLRITRTETGEEYDLRKAEFTELEASLNKRVAAGRIKLINGLVYGRSGQDQWLPFAGDVLFDSLK